MRDHKMEVLEVIQARQKKNEGKGEVKGRREIDTRGESSSDANGKAKENWSRDEPRNDRISSVQPNK
jgi:hypothetical protein